MNKKNLAALGVAATAILVAATSSAHISVTSGAAVPDANTEVTFGVGHGCEGSGGAVADTIKVVIDIPAGVTGVRAMPNPFGKAVVTATTVTYEKVPADYLATDSAYYKFTLRLKPPPGSAFTKIYFPAHQYCNGVAEPVNWTALPGTDAGSDTAPELLVMPARQAGWNEYTVPADIAPAAFPSFFKDALIVWKGNAAAYSPNTATRAQIAGEGVAALTELKANDKIWVRY